MKAFRRILAVFLFLSVCCSGALAADDGRDAAFDAALAALRTPSQAAEESGTLYLHTGETVFLPCVHPGVIPFDEQNGAPAPAASGTFQSSAPGIISVDEQGRVTAEKEGTARVRCSGDCGTHTYIVVSSPETPPETVRNYIYVLNREFDTVRRGRLKKSNQYTKWYYGSKKEVGWCSVFTIFCANAAGFDPIKLNDLNTETPPEVCFLKEGQVGHQYDGFFAMDRFVSVPKPGYLVIYAELNNGYRTTHIASVADVEDRGNGLYAVTTIEGNMSNTVKGYRYLYDSAKANNLVGTEKGLRLQKNMSVLPAEEQTDARFQYELHTDHWAVFGFCATW